MPNTDRRRSRSTRAIGSCRDSAWVLFTDGLTEARNQADEEFGEPRLLEALLLHRTCSAPALQARLADAVATFTGGALQDDATLMVLAADQG